MNVISKYLGAINPSTDPGGNEDQNSPLSTTTLLFFAALSGTLLLALSRYYPKNLEGRGSVTPPPLANLINQVVGQRLSSGQRRYYIKALTEHLDTYPQDLSRCSDIVHNLVQTEELNDEWVTGNLALFKEVVLATKGLLEKIGRSETDILNRLKEELSILMSFQKFKKGHFDILLEQIPGFDPSTSKEFIYTARSYRRADLFVLPPLEKLEIDYTEFKHAGLKAQPIFGHKPGSITEITSIEAIYGVIGPIPSLEGDLAFFRMNVEACLYGPKEGLNLVRGAYQKELNDIQRTRELLQKGNIKIHYLDNFSSIKVQVLQFMGRSVVCKIESSCVNGFRSILDTVDFIEKCIALNLAVPNVVKLLPDALLIKGDEEVEIGYLMEIANGKPLSAIKKLPPDEKWEIQRQFNLAVPKMLESGYALYHFHNQNVIWNGKTLTFIDLSRYGFDEKNIKAANTLLAIRAMEMILASIDS